jgi:aspartate-semialdehyde dehydrogenase
VIDGHTMTVSVELRRSRDRRGGRRAARIPGRAADAEAADGAAAAILVMDAINRPQPRLDADLGGGMMISVGRVRDVSGAHAQVRALGHNTIRGAAGASVLNAELMKAKGLL